MFQSYKNILVPIFVMGILFFSCKKTDESITGIANIALVNASYGLGPVELASSGATITTSPVSFGMPSGTVDDPYISINAGLRNFRVLTSAAEVYNANFNIGLNQYYSLLVFDTINSSGKISSLLMKDDLSMPDSGISAIRFLNLSRDAGPVDVYFVSATDTLVKEDNDYIGYYTPLDATAGFNLLDSGQYLLSVNVADTTIQLTNTNIQLAQRKKYTVYIAGRRSDGSLRIFSYPHF